MQLLAEIINALFNLLLWIGVALVLVMVMTLAFWYGAKAWDKVQAIRWERERAKWVAFKRAQDAVMGAYAPGTTVTYITFDRPRDRWMEAAREEIAVMVGDRALPQGGSQP